MLILFDQGTPAPLRALLAGHSVITAHERGWSTLKNGDLLAAAEAEGFEILVTTDRNLKYQQNLTRRAIAVVVLSTTSWPRIRSAGSLVISALASVPPSGFLEVEIP